MPWTGLIQIEESKTAALELMADTPAEVLLDGELTQASSGELTSMDLLPGWHVVEVRLDIDELGGPVSLQWVGPPETESIVSASLFPLAQLDGWRHTRSMGLPGNARQSVSQRLDFSPHMALASVLQLSTPTREQFVTEERWDGVLQLEEASNLSLRSDFRSGTVTILIDGEEVASGQSGAQQTTTHLTNVQLPARRHTVQLLQTLEREPTWSGDTLSIHAIDGSSPVVTPYSRLQSTRRHHAPGLAACSRAALVLTFRLLRNVTRGLAPSLGTSEKLRRPENQPLHPSMEYSSRGCFQNCCPWRLIPSSFCLVCMSATLHSEDF